MAHKGKAVEVPHFQPKHSIHPSLINRRVLVTGGATGIGAAFVSLFHSQGAKVVFLDVDTEHGTRLVQKLGGGRCSFIACDVASSEELAAGLASAERYLDGFDVLINNAASDLRHSTLDVSESMFDELMAVNVKQQFFTAQHVLRRMLGDNLPQGGVVLNVSSCCWLIGRCPDYPVYMMAKAAVHGMTQSLGREFGAQGVRVNSIMPGWVITDKQLRFNLDATAEAHLMDEQCLKEVQNATNHRHELVNNRSERGAESSRVERGRVGTRWRGGRAPRSR